VAIDREEIEALAAEYVLGTLDAGERRAAEVRLSADPAFRAAVAAWAERLQPLADTAAPVAPPGDAFGRILARIDARPEASAMAGSTDNVVALRRSVRRWRIVSVLAAAAAVVLAVFVAVDRTSPVRTEYVAMLTPDGGTPAFVLTVDTASNTLSIRRVVDAAPASGRSYELWAVEAGEQPVSMGVVDTVSYTRELPYAPDGLVFAISDEPAGGSPTGLVTGPVIFSGPLVPAQ
jgi:anti-sigma-K factor RskA